MSHPGRDRWFRQVRLWTHDPNSLLRQWCTVNPKLPYPTLFETFRTTTGRVPRSSPSQTVVCTQSWVPGPEPGVRSAGKIRLSAVVLPFGWSSRDPEDRPSRGRPRTEGGSERIDNRIGGSVFRSVVQVDKVNQSEERWVGTTRIYTLPVTSLDVGHRLRRHSRSTTMWGHVSTCGPTWT